MIYLYFFKKITIINVLFFLSLSCYSQINKENIYKKYNITAAQGKNDAALVLYKDGTFVNFGLICDEKEKEWYIWLTSGNYLEVPGKFLLKSTLEIDKMNPLLQNIKNHYKYRTDHALIVSDYEYQLENYKDLPLIIDNNKLIDASKKIEYREDK